MGPSPSEFIIVPRRPASRRLPLWIGLGWALSLVLCGLLVQRWSAPLLGESMDQLDALNRENLALQVKLEASLQESAVLRRSEATGRDALGQLQALLVEREEEVAALRADLAFYERLVGGSAGRKGLAVHSAVFEPGELGELRYEITLTQNLKTAGVTEGGLSFAIEGMQGGELKRVEWAQLSPQHQGKPQPFSFRYFQQLSGSVLLPEGLQPQKLRVRLRRNGADVEQTIPWEDTRKEAGA